MAAALILGSSLLAFGQAAAGPAGGPVPSRIVMGGKAVVLVADIVYAFPSVYGRVAGVGTADQGLGAFLPMVDPGFATLPPLDRQAGPEAIAALRPDLVILKSALRKSLGAGLQALGIKVMYLDLESPEDYARDITALGLALGDPGRAKAILSFYDGILSRVKAGVASSRSRTPRVLVLQPSTGDSFEVPPVAWMQGRIVEAAGGEICWKGANPGEGWGRVSFEQIAAWNPDFIAVVSYKEDSAALAARLRADPRFAALAAGRAGAILGVPQDFYSWDQPDARWILGLEWLAKALRPEAFRDLSVQAEAARFFSFMYGIDAARFASAIAPRLKGDYALR